jgi:hypothetical protein
VSLFDINLTFFLQVAHFWIAYLLLDRFLFRRLFFNIEVELVVQHDLENKISTLQHAVAHQEELFKATAQELRAVLLTEKNTIPLEQQETVVVFQQEAEIVLSDAERVQLVNQLTRLMVDRVMV